jgi:hypothetical protein
LLDFWQDCHSPEEFFDRLTDTLRRLPEDKTVPYNITSLHNHLMLVGKLFRTLDAAVSWDGKQVGLGKSAVSQIGQATGTRVNEAPSRGSWLGTLALIRADFSQTLVRLADLNVLVARQRAINATKEKFPDHVLYTTPDSLLAFLPEGGPVTMEQFLAVILERGFGVETKSLTAELGLLASDFDRRYDEFHTRGLAAKRSLRLVQQPFSPQERWPEQIRGKLCEVCQVRPSRSSPWVTDLIEEWLCDSCVDIRGMHEPATEIAAWTDAVIWVKVSLDRDHLLRVLPDLFRAYLHDALPGATDEKIRELEDQFRALTPEIDFIQDYLEFAKQFREGVVGDLTRRDQGFTPAPWTYTLSEYTELAVCPVVSNREFLIVCRRFINLMRDKFLRSVASSPIGLSLSLSPSKHPYQEHWRFLTGRGDPQSPIRVQRANDFEFSMTIPQFEALDSLFSHSDPPTSAALHRLAAIERTSRSPSAVLFEAFGDNRLRPLLRPLLFEHQLPMETILNFYKLAVWQEESRATHERILQVLPQV